MDEATAKKARNWNNIIVLLLLGMFVGYVVAETKHYFQDKAEQAEGSK